MAEVAAPISITLVGDGGFAKQLPTDLRNDSGNDIKNDSGNDIKK